jgi:hypothetical protein
MDNHSSRASGFVNRGSVRLYLLSAALGIFALATTSQAVLVTGDPSTDTGWTYSANVLDNGAYVRGTANFGFGMYHSSFLADAASASAVGAGWSAGDTILGMGGKRQSTDGVTAGWGAAFTGASVNTTNLTSSARVVAKFGTLISNSVSLSTIRPDGGNGSGSFSGGELGDGAILFGTPNSGGFFTLGNQNTFLSFLTNQRYSGGVSNISTDYGRIIYQLGSDNLLDSWEVLLNTSLLADTYSNVPTPGATSVLTMQRGAGVFTDGALSIEAAAVPEANAFLFGGVATFVVTLVFAGRWFTKNHRVAWLAVKAS